MHFFVHVAHAILINLMRTPGYALLTFGRSLVVSVGLILFEIAILPLALVFDIWALRWRNRGIPIMEWDFEPMTKIRKFQLTPEATDIPSEVIKWENCSQLRKDLFKHIKINEWQQADFCCVEFLKKGKGGPLIIHFVESVGRCIAVTLYLQEKGFLKSLTGSEVKSFYFQRACLTLFQTIGFEGAFVLDRLARAIRRKGVMILSDDVPPITRLPEGK